MVKELNFETEAKILNAAKEILFKHGKNGTRMQAIADAANVNKALVHYYYRSKEKLYTKVLDGVLQELFESVFLNVDFNASIKEFIKEFIFNHIKFIATHKDEIQFFLAEVTTNYEKVASMMKSRFVLFSEGSQPIHILIKNKITEAAKNGEIINIEPANLMINVLSLDIFFFILSPMLHLILESSQEEQNKIFNERANHVFNFVWRAIKK